MKTLPGWHELPKFPVGSKISGCRACGLVFTTPRSFDKHRGRGCCLTATELTATGWSVDKNGRWHPKARPMGAKFAASLARGDAVADDLPDPLPTTGVRAYPRQRGA